MKINSGLLIVFSKSIYHGAARNSLWKRIVKPVDIVRISIANKR
jgi:hypothetical protein